MSGTCTRPRLRRFKTPLATLILWSAVEYIKRSDIDDTVKVIKIDGKAPADAGDKLQTK